MEQIRRKVFDVIQIGNKRDIPSKVFDIFIVVAILSNLFVVIFETFDESIPYLPILKTIEFVTILIFVIEYILRLWTADFLYPDKSRAKAVWAFMISFFGVIDLITILPYFLPFVFPHLSCSATAELCCIYGNTFRLYA